MKPGDVVFLSNGAECYLKEILSENRYIINRIMAYQDDEGDWNDVIEERDVVVNEVFTKRPTEKIHKSIHELKKKLKETEKSVSNKRKELSVLEYKIASAAQTQISNEKFIINKSELINAKELVLFPKDRVMPIRVVPAKNGLKLLMEVQISYYGGTEERFWGYNLYNDDGSYRNSGEFLDPKHGIMIDPTEEQVEERIRLRLKELPFNENQLRGVDDKYLNAEQLEKKRATLKSISDRDKASLRNQITDLTNRLQKLEGIEETP